MHTSSPLSRRGSRSGYTLCAPPNKPKKTKMPTFASSYKGTSHPTKSVKKHTRSNKAKRSQKVSHCLSSLGSADWIARKLLMPCVETGTEIDPSYQLKLRVEHHLTPELYASTQPGACSNRVNCEQLVSKREGKVSDKGHLFVDAPSSVPVGCSATAP